MLHHYILNFKTNAKPILVLILLICCFAMQSAIAQRRALVTGVVTDAEGSRLPGATVRIAGTSTGTATDVRGEYSLFVNPGTITLEVNFIGNLPKTETLEVSPGETVIFNVSLEPDVVELGQVNINARLEGQQSALNQQKSSSTIKNIVAADQIGAFPDQNSAEALQRIPGINVQRDEGDGRDVLVRGLAPQFTNISINGEQIPSPEAGMRSVALDAVPADQLASIEVTKALTPDMDGDAVGGSVNLVTQTANSEELIIRGRASIEYNDPSGKVAPQGNLSISKRTKGGKFGYILNGTYNASNRSTDRMEFDDWENGVPGVVEVADYTITRNRIGASTTMDYQFNKNSHIYIRGLFSEVQDHELRRQLVFEEGDPLVKELKDRLENQGVYNIGLGGRSEGSKMKIDYEVTYGKAYQNTPYNNKTEFETEETPSYSINTNDKYSPRIENFTYDGDQNISYTNSSIYKFSLFEESETLAEDQNITAKTNIALPLTLGKNTGEIKFGGKVRLKDKKYTFKKFEQYELAEDDQGDPVMDLTLSQFDDGFTDKDFMDGEFGGIGYWPNTSFIDFINANRNSFETDPDVFLEESTLEGYDASENVYAGYVQGMVQFDKLMVLGGVRYELTKVDYKSGTFIADAEEGEPSVVPVTGKSDYAFLLPMLHFKYSVNNNTNLRLAGTRSYSRPNFEDLVQGAEIDKGKGEATISNPDLLPVDAINLDLFGEHYLGTVGLISAGVFYKRLDNFIYKQTTDRTLPGRGADIYEVTQAVNGGTASLIGAEVAWQQNFTKLPGFLGGLGIYLNYTYTQSEAEVENFSEDEDITSIDLPGQAKHVGNFALVYTKGGFNGRISYNYNGKYIDEIDGGDLIVFDNRGQLDVSASQSFMEDKLSIFVDVVNITNENQLQYYNTSDTPAQRESWGFWTRLGVRFNL